KLIESGRIQQAQVEIQTEIIKKIGVSGVNDLTDLGDSSTRLSKAWADFNLRLQAALAGPLAGLLDWVAGIVAASNQRGAAVSQIADIEQGLSGAKRNEFLNRLNQINLAEGGIGQGILRDFGIGRSAKDIARMRADLINEYAPLAKPLLPKGEKTPEQIEADLDKSIEVANKIRSLRQQGVDVERNAQDLRLNIEDAVYGLRKRAADMEREAVQFRRSVEDQIFSKRQDLEQKFIDNDRKRQQNIIDAFDLQLQKAGAGLDQTAQGIVDAARQYIKTRAEGEADLLQNEKQLQLSLRQIDQETNRYRLEVENRVLQMSIQRDEFSRDVTKSRLQLERSIQDYAIKTEEYRLAMTKHRYEVEINLEKKKQIAAQIAPTGGNGPVDRLMGSAAQREKFVQSQLVARWFTPEQMAAVMGSIRQESTFNPYAKEKDGTGLGLFQWSFGRAKKVPKFTGNWQKDIQNQLDLFQEELRSTEAKAGQKLMGATTLQAAALGMKQFERYGKAGKRYDYMKDYYLRFTNRAETLVSAETPVSPETPQPVVPGAPSAPVLPSAPQLVSVNDLLSQYIELQARIKLALADNNKVLTEKLELDAESAKFALEQQTVAPIRQFQEQNKELQLEIEKRRLRNRLLMEGVKPEIVEGEIRVLELNKTLNSVLRGIGVSTNELVKAELARVGLNPKLIDSTFKLTEATLASLVATTEDVKKQEQLRKKLQAILDLKNRLEGKATSEADLAGKGARAAAEQDAAPGQKIQEFIANATRDLNDLEALAIRVSQGIGDAVGNSLANGITGLIEGTATAKEVFAGFLKEVGQILIQEGTKMIATYVAIGIARMFAGFGGKGGDGGNAATALGSNPNVAKYAPLANGGVFDGGFTAFAKGGMFTNSIVSSPTLFRFADGAGFSAGLMGEAGPEAIMPLTRGPGGRLGVDASGSGESINVTVNVDASGSKVQGDDQSANQLGRVVANAVQQELIKQKRPGGLLS
ncbi:MAG: hypothetical protein EBW87_03265, partial [Burkholderiaceae bacterium]|nr:hypothetical protein [Burkholderiaceae bacterium]